MFVLDASVTMAWGFQDERTTYTETVLRKFSTESCIVPLLWIAEIANILQIGVKRNRITESEVSHFCTLLASLPITIDNSQCKIIDLFNHCKLTGLTSYDAQYLTLAHDHQLPIATLDQGIIRAAKQLAAPLFLESL